MPVVSTRWLVTLAAVAAYVAVSLIYGGDVVAQKKEEKGGDGAKAVAKETNATPMFYGVAACSNEGCHGGAPKKWIEGKELLCRCIEGDLWAKHDKHADAYNVLTKERGKRMGKILGYKDDPKTWKACLVCHAAVVDDPKLEAESKKRLFKIEEGVNCVVCHGAYLEWARDHGNLFTAPDWRDKTRDQKFKQGGMTNLWDPVKRAELCASCHIGNLKQGKFVTHEMYAAGHPPLPGFEAAMFSEEMPRHWEYLREKKSEKVRKELGLIPGEQEQTRLLLVGSLVALRDSMRLLADQAENCLTAKDDDGKVLDLSNFDCYSCHHDLKAPSWRQKREYPGKPGRVPMKEWPTELVKLALAQAYPEAKAMDEQAKAFATAQKKLRDAFVERQYGNPKAIQAAAAALADWADELVKKVHPPTEKDRKALTEKDVSRLLEKVPALYGGKALDYDSARQVGWAFDVMYNELHGYPYKRDGIPQVAPPRKADDKVRKVQKNLEGFLRLRLPQGRTKIIEDELADNLKALNDYDPAKFQGYLNDLKKALALGAGRAPALTRLTAHDKLPSPTLDSRGAPPC